MLTLLIRHASTPETGRVLTGWRPGVHLSPQGEQEVAALVERLQSVRIDAVYASTIDRALETATPLARSHRLRVRIRKPLGDVRYGDWEGRSLKALARTKLWSQILARPSDIRFPNGETIRETQARAIGAIERIRSDHAGRTVAIVTHADIVRLAVAHYAGTFIDNYSRLVVETASVSVLWLGEVPRVLKLNDTGLTLPRFSRIKR